MAKRYGLTTTQTDAPSNVIIKSNADGTYSADPQFLKIGYVFDPFSYQPTGSNVARSWDELMSLMTHASGTSDVFTTIGTYKGGDDYTIPPGTYDLGHVNLIGSGNATIMEIVDGVYFSGSRNCGFPQSIKNMSIGLAMTGSGDRAVSTLDDSSRDLYCTFEGVEFLSATDILDYPMISITDAQASCRINMGAGTAFESEKGECFFLMTAGELNMNITSPGPNSANDDDILSTNAISGSGGSVNIFASPGAKIPSEGTLDDFGGTYNIQGIHETWISAVDAAPAGSTGVAVLYGEKSGEAPIELKYRDDDDSETIITQEGSLSNPLRFTTTLQSGSFSAAYNEYCLVDLDGPSLDATGTLPSITARNESMQVGFKIAGVASGYALRITSSITDGIDGSDGIVLTVDNDSVVLQVDSTRTKWWTV